MVEISDKLNRAFNANEREIKAYISVELDKPEFEENGYVMVAHNRFYQSICGVIPTGATDIHLTDQQKKELLSNKDISLEENRTKASNEYSFINKVEHKRLKTDKEATYYIELSKTDNTSNLSLHTGQYSGTLVDKIKVFDTIIDLTTTLNKSTYYILYYNENENAYYLTFFTGDSTLDDALKSANEGEYSGTTGNILIKRDSNNIISFKEATFNDFMSTNNNKITFLGYSTQRFASHINNNELNTYKIYYNNGVLTSELSNITFNGTNEHSLYFNEYTSIEYTNINKNIYIWDGTGTKAVVNDEIYNIYDLSVLTGLITKSIASDTNNRCIFDLEAEHFKKGSRFLSIFFDDNIPSTIKLQETNSKFATIDIIGNTRQIVNIDLGTTIDDSDNRKVNITITLSGFNKPEQRVRIKRIEFGYNTRFYEDDIISLNITENVKKFCEETPENECIVKLQNIDDKFNILNPQGITDVLKENSIIKAYIGAVCEDNTIEYVDMGIYYLDKWENNYDNTATLYCKNMIKLIKELDIPVKENEESPFKMSMIPTYLTNYLTSVCEMNNNIELNGQSRAITTNMNSKSYNFLEYLQLLTVAYNDILYIDRNNTLNMIPINKQIIMNIDDNMYIDQPKINKIDKVNTVIFIKRRFANEFIDWLNINDTQISYTMKTTGKEIYILKFNNPTTFGDTSELIEDGVLLLNSDETWIYNPCEFYFVFEGTIGDTFSYNVKLYQYKVNEEKIAYTNKNENEKEVVMEIDNDFIYADNTRERCYQHYLDNATQYEVEFDFIGNPALEAGDVVSVQTDYQQINTFIESIEYNFDGGFRCSIKGVDINV